MKRTTQEILEKAEQFRENALTAPAAYRLYIFVPWANIPEDIKPHFKDEVHEDWDKNITTEDLDVDIKINLIGVINDLIKTNSVAALYVISNILADLYMMGIDTLEYEAWFETTCEFYTNDLKEDPEFAGITLINSLSPMLAEIMELVDPDSEINVAAILEELVGKLVEKVEKQNHTDLDASIDAAFAKHKEQTGEDLLQDITDNPDIVDTIYVEEDEANGLKH